MGSTVKHPDGLEITSIGILYKGLLEKKYWSSSRGKEKYPYPVGYQATRWHGGHSYFMEVSEGPRGPSFVVTCEEGIACSGQTPSVAWEDILKKKHAGAKRVLVRSSCTSIDGPEMFGFTHPLVQRLCRDLVVSASGVAENSQLMLSAKTKENHADGDELESRSVGALAESSGKPPPKVKRAKKSIASTSSKHVEQGVHKPRNDVKRFPAGTLDKNLDEAGQKKHEMAEPRTQKFKPQSKENPEKLQVLHDVGMTAEKQTQICSTQKGGVPNMAPVSFEGEEVSRHSRQSKRPRSCRSKGSHLPHEGLELESACLTTSPIDSELGNLMRAYSPPFEMKRMEREENPVEQSRKGSVPNMLLPLRNTDAECEYNWKFPIGNTMQESPCGSARGLERRACTVDGSSLEAIDCSNPPSVDEGSPNNLSGKRRKLKLAKLGKSLDIVKYEQYGTNVDLTQSEGVLSIDLMCPSADDLSNQCPGTLIGLENPCALSLSPLQEDTTSSSRQDGVFMLLEACKLAGDSFSGNQKSCSREKIETTDVKRKRVSSGTDCSLRLASADVLCHTFSNSTQPSNEEYEAAKRFCSSNTVAVLQAGCSPCPDLKATGSCNDPAEHMHDLSVTGSSMTRQKNDQFEVPLVGPDIGETLKWGSHGAMCNNQESLCTATVTGEFRSLEIRKDDDSTAKQHSGGECTVLEVMDSVQNPGSENPAQKAGRSNRKSESQEWLIGASSLDCSPSTYMEGITVVPEKNAIDQASAEKRLFVVEDEPVETVRPETQSKTGIRLVEPAISSSETSDSKEKTTDVPHFQNAAMLQEILNPISSCDDAHSDQENLESELRGTFIKQPNGSKKLTVSKAVEQGGLLFNNHPTIGSQHDERNTGNHFDSVANSTGGVLISKVNVPIIVMEEISSSQVLSVEVSSATESSVVKENEHEMVLTSGGINQNGVVTGLNTSFQVGQPGDTISDLLSGASRFEGSCSDSGETMSKLLQSDSVPLGVTTCELTSGFETMKVSAVMALKDIECGAEKISESSDQDAMSNVVAPSNQVDLPTIPIGGPEMNSMVKCQLRGPPRNSLQTPNETFLNQRPEEGLLPSKTDSREGFDSKVSEKVLQDFNKEVCSVIMAGEKEAVCTLDFTFGSTNQYGVATVLSPGHQVDLLADTLPEDPVTQTRAYICENRAEKLTSLKNICGTYQLVPTTSTKEQVRLMVGPQEMEKQSPPVFQAKIDPLSCTEAEATASVQVVGQGDSVKHCMIADIQPPSGEGHVLHDRTCQSSDTIEVSQVEQQILPDECEVAETEDNPNFEGQVVRPCTLKGCAAPVEDYGIDDSQPTKSDTTRVTNKLPYDVPSHLVQFSALPVMDNQIDVPNTSLCSIHSGVLKSGIDDSQPTKSDTTRVTNKLPYDVPSHLVQLSALLVMENQIDVPNTSLCSVRSDVQNSGPSKNQNQTVVPCELHCNVLNQGHHSESADDQRQSGESDPSRRELTKSMMTLLLPQAVPLLAMRVTDEKSISSGMDNNVCLSGGIGKLQKTGVLSNSSKEKFVMASSQVSEIPGNVDVDNGKMCRSDMPGTLKIVGQSAHKTMDVPGLKTTNGSLDEPGEAFRPKIGSEVMEVLQVLSEDCGPPQNQSPTPDEGKIPKNLMNSHGTASLGGDLYMSAEGVHVHGLGNCDQVSPGNRETSQVVEGEGCGDQSFCHQVVHSGVLPKCAEDPESSQPAVFCRGDCADTESPCQDDASMATMSIDRDNVVQEFDVHLEEDMSGSSVTFGVHSNDNVAVKAMSLDCNLGKNERNSTEDGNSDSAVPTIHLNHDCADINSKIRDRDCLKADSNGSAEASRVDDTRYVGPPFDVQKDDIQGDRDCQKADSNGSKEDSLVDEDHYNRPNCDVLEGSKKGLCLDFQMYKPEGKNERALLRPSGKQGSEEVPSCSKDAQVHLPDAHHGLALKVDASDHPEESCTMAEAQEQIKDSYLEGTVCPNPTVFPGHDSHLTSEKQFKKLQELETAICIEQELPVLGMVLNVRGNDIRLCVCCGVDATERTFFIYQMLCKENAKLQNPILLGVVETTFEDSADIAVKMKFPIEESGVGFTPDGQQLILLDCFKLHNSCKMKINGYDGGGIKVVSFEKDLQVSEHLQSDGPMRCLAVVGPQQLIAAGDRGCINCWNMDSSWRTLKERCSLPPAAINGVPFTSVTNLSIVPCLPHMVVGCAPDGFFAVWDSIRRTLLWSSHLHDHILLKGSLVDLPSTKLEKLESPGDSGFGGISKEHAEFGAEEFISGSATVCMLTMVASGARQLPGDNSKKDEPKLLGDDVGRQWDCKIVLLKAGGKILCGPALPHRPSALLSMGCCGVMGSSDGLVHLWDVQSGIKISTLHELQGSSIVSLAISPASEVLATAGKNKQVFLYVQKDHFAGLVN